jgi:hypothetical protein
MCEMRFACACVNVRMRSECILFNIECSKDNTQTTMTSLQSISQYSPEHSIHVSDTRDIPAPNVLVEGTSVTMSNKNDEASFNFNHITRLRERILSRLYGAVC